MYTLPYNHPRRTLVPSHSFDFFEPVFEAPTQVTQSTDDLEQLYERYHSLEQQRQEAAAAIANAHKRQELQRLAVARAVQLHQQRQRRLQEQESLERAWLQRRAQLLHREAEEQQFKEALVQGINEALQNALLTSDSSQLQLKEDKRAVSAPTETKTATRSPLKTKKETKKASSEPEESKEAPVSPLSVPCQATEPRVVKVKVSPSSISSSIPVRIVRSEAAPAPLKIATSRSEVTPQSATPTPSSSVSVEDETIKNFNLDAEDFALASRARTPQPLSPRAKTESEKTEQHSVHESAEKSDRVVSDTA
jgi:hypothetical protein